jgi:hypothetical protein
LSDFSVNVSKCIADWGKSAANCNGNIECLDSCGRQLRKCLDDVFPYSKKIELESDKVNYMLSSLFFLANRLAKASTGLAEFDNAITGIQKIGDISKISTEEKENKELYEKIRIQIDEILAKYF